MRRLRRLRPNKLVTGLTPSPGIKGAHRNVRSFVLREGRLTSGQQRALETHWAAYGLTPVGVLDFDEVFMRRAPVTLEIGFGNGDNLLAMACAEPQADFLGIEMHRPGIGRLLHRAAEAGLSNLKVVRADAVEVLQRHIAAAALERVVILFPDPWPKRRHHKRRLMTPAFVGTLAAKLHLGGLLHLATDWREYAEAMRVAVVGSGEFEPAGDTEPVPQILQTRFERRGRDAGREAIRLSYRRV